MSIRKGTTIISGKGANGSDGQDGQDGFSPIATVTKSDSTATISITDKNGTTTAQVSDGATYTLPTASSSTLGGIKVGTNLSIDGSGVLSASGGTAPIYYWDKTSGSDSKTLLTELIGKYRNNEPFVLIAKYYDSASVTNVYNLCILALNQNINGYGYIYEICSGDTITHKRHNIYVDGYAVTSISLNSSTLTGATENWVTTWFLGKYNTSSYTPSGDYNPATKKYVDDGLANKQNTIDSNNKLDYQYLSNTPTIPTNSDFTLNGLSEKSYTNLTDKPTIPTALSDLSDDSTHRVVTDTEKTTWSGKQDVLSSGTNIKTINNESILGSGNITVGGGGTATDVQINGTSIVSSNTANIITESAYDSTNNKIATMSDLELFSKYINARHKVLWTGTWSSGSLTITDLRKYHSILVHVDSSRDPIPCYKDNNNHYLGAVILGSGSSGSQWSKTFRCTIDTSNPNKITWENSKEIAHNASSNHGSASNKTVYKIVGLDPIISEL